MRLPNGDKAIIDLRQFQDYVLNDEHEEGRHKAKLFRELVGVTWENVDFLVEDLRIAVLLNDAIEGKEDIHGKRFIIDGSSSKCVPNEVKSIPFTPG
ncbi:MAG: DUF6883 domain-containing protein [bacterium]